jgi:predicted Zn-ribbon and HTH transcriptional regulator
MTDTRATERLLELVAERGDPVTQDIVRELLRRGDTLVAFRDLEEVVELARRAGVESEALDRLERKLGGRPRRGKA